MRYHTSFIEWKFDAGQEFKNWTTWSDPHVYVAYTGVKGKESQAYGKVTSR